MKTVMVLSSKGERERAASEPELPADLGRLLALVDGRHSQDDLVRQAGDYALAAGGLRWLLAAGYVENRLADAWPDSAALATQPSALTVHEVCNSLRAYLLTQARQHEGPDMAACLAPLTAARQLGELLPLVNPLMGAVQARSGALAAADLAETVAQILSPLEGRPPHAPGAAAQGVAG